MFSKAKERKIKENRGKTLAKLFSRGPFSRTLIIVVLVVLAIYTAMIFGLLFSGIWISLKHSEDWNYTLLSWTEGWANSDGSSIFSNFVAFITGAKADGTKIAIDKITRTYYVGDTKVTHEAVDINFIKMLGNSLLYCVIGSVVQTIVPCVVAFLLCKYKFKFSKIMYAVVLMVFIIPIVGNLPATVTVLRNLGLYDNWIGYFVLKFNFTGMYFFVFYAHFERLSDSYMEAAEIDGASQFRTMISIAFPQARSLITTVMLINFVTLWNDYQNAILYMPTHPTLSYGLYELFFKKQVIDLPTKIASFMTFAIPILVLFIFLKEKLMEQNNLGGVKE